MSEHTAGPPYLREVSLSQKHSTIRTIRFHTAVERLKPNNCDFVLRFYLPLSNNEGPYDRVMILLNGLCEVDVRVYDDLGDELARHGLPSVLLPLPNHFCRWCQNPKSHDAEDNVDPEDPFTFKKGTRFGVVTANIKQRLLSSENILPQGFYQVMKDLEKLIGCLKADGQFVGAENHNFFESHFTPETRVSLYGYSLGGLLALSALLYMPSKLNCCVVVNSGASIQDVNLPSLIFSNAREWEEAQMQAYGGFGDQPLPPKLRQIYSRIFLGNDRILLRRMLKNHYQQLLFVVGARDEVFSLREVLQIAPGQTGLAVLQVPLLGHWIGVQVHDQGDRPTWNLWKSFIVRSMIAFEEDNPGHSRFMHLLDLLRYEILGEEEGEQLFGRLLVADQKAEVFRLEAVSSNLSTIRGLREIVPLVAGYEGQRYERARKGSDPVDCEVYALTEKQVEAANYESPEIRLFEEQGFRSLAVAPLPVTNEPHCLGILLLYSNKEPVNSILRFLKSVTNITSTAAIISALLLKDRENRGLQGP